MIVLQKHCSVIPLRLLFAADTRSSVFFIFYSGCGIIDCKLLINDLSYNLLIAIMDIKNVPNNADNLNLASGKYNMDRRYLETLHGLKSLMEEVK